MITNCTNYSNYRPAFKAKLSTDYEEDNPRWANIKKIYEQKTAHMPECQLDVLDEFDSGIVLSLDNNKLETTIDAELNLKGTKKLMALSDKEIANKFAKFTQSIYNYDTTVRGLLISFKELMQKAKVDKKSDYKQMFNIFTDYAGPKQLEEAKQEIYQDELFRNHLKIDV